MGTRSRSRPGPRGFSDQHSTMTNIDWRPDHQGGMGNSMFQDAVYRTEAPEQCAPVGGGFGGVLGALMGGLGGASGGDTCADPVQRPVTPAQPEVLWV
jgi:hypothetical protein